jgi:hypothetical protein
MKVSFTETKQDPLVLLRDVPLGFFVVLRAKADDGGTDANTLGSCVHLRAHCGLSSSMPKSQPRGWP